jgi:chromosome segregation protein
LLKFNKIRLTGFKSFVDATELTIESGLTGVVGPNGCGKSNLVEALRWAMGETSAKQMRGSGMDDVIFGGTAERPARNIAEVVLQLDNRERSAPAQFNEFEDLDVSRRIEREKGSTYRVNGKEVRAKDVQLLFADSSTGARSTAMVSQGRIGAVINAKPIQRRSLLEEAAGITGLHSRRHEAELRLRGAETNLERLEDILGTLDVQMKGLKKQARQATRYRNISDHIRKAEATLYHLRWQIATAEAEANSERLAEATTKVEELSRIAAGASTNQADAASNLPALREAEATAAAELHRLTVARDGLDEEEQRINEARTDTETRLVQIAADLERERTLSDDAARANSRLNDERLEVEAASEGEEETGAQAREQLDRANATVTELDEKTADLTHKAANDEAREASLTRSVSDLEQRLGRLSERLEDATASQEQLRAEEQDNAALAEADTALNQARSELESARERLEAAEAARTDAANAASEAVSAQHETDAALTRLLTEEKTLAEVLKSDTDSDLPPLIDELTVTPGYETPLGAALGENLSAPTDESAPIRWRTLLPFSNPSALPAGCQALSNFVSGPAALNRRLSQIGVVSDEAEGQRLSEQLSQGQCLVSRDGGFWRWDGFTVSSGAETAAAARLEQLNRLAEIRDRLGATRTKAEAAEATAGRSRTAASETETAAAEARANAQGAETALGRCRDSQTAIREKAAHQNSKLAALGDTIGGLQTELTETQAGLEEAKQSLASLPDIQATRQDLYALRGKLTERRAIQIERQSAFDQLQRAAEARHRRLADIERETANWNERAQGAVQQITQLEERQRAETTERERLVALPADIEAKRVILMESIDTSTATRKQLADNLAKAENRLAEADKALREAEAGLALARETRVRAEGLVEQSEQASEGIIERVLDKLDTTPDQLFEIAGLSEDKELPELEATERRVERLIRERDTMGPVNLRAEAETKELTEQVGTLETERDDLIEAIAKLRKGISELNREGRKRLLESFHEVDKHFQELFVRLFGGGTAHLSLTDSEDPLDAGLEIMASPPGKRMQVLSLLSGGEQALTALALLFGVFLTNPAPICVLDEVDAPLDDANVDRFCSMLDEMSAAGRTRFLVITHHRLTMARMHRLFGVTMSERGVSQLVSVDLQQAEHIRATA